MAKYQSTFTDPAKGSPGRLSDSSPAPQIDSDRVNAEASTTIGFGRAVVFGSGERDLKLPASASDVANKLEGVTLAIPGKPVLNETTGARGFQPDEPVSILVRNGRVWVEVEQAVAKGDPVFVRYTADGAKTPGAFRKDSDGGSAGVTQKISLTLDGVLDGGRRRIQKLVLDVDLVAADTVNGKIGGTAIAPTVFGVDHATTMASIVAAIRAAAVTAGVALLDVVVAGATGREIHVYSADVGDTTAVLADWAVTHGGAGTAVFASATGADVLAGKAAHEPQVRIGGDVLYKAAWAGSHDDTVALFADQLRADARIAEVEITTVPDTEDLVLTLTAANVGDATIDADQAQVNGGVNVRTLTANNAVRAGSAAVAGKAGQAAGWKWKTGGSTLAELEIP